MVLRVFLRCRWRSLRLVYEPKSMEGRNNLSNCIRIEIHPRMSYIDRQETAMKPKTLETRLLKRIDRKRGDVFLRADFGDLGGYDQVGRALRQFVREGRLVRERRRRCRPGGW